MERPSPLTMLVRGATMACAVCGVRRGLFDRWRLLADCPRCGLHFEREEGQWIGAVAVNTMLSVAALVVGEIVLFAAMYPDLGWEPVLAVNLAVGLGAPVIFYPTSKTLWVAMTLLMEPLRPGEVYERYAWPASRWPSRDPRPRS